MVDKIMCDACHKMNDINKFCIYCGHKLLDEEQIELILENPDPYCLNCGRTVKKGQTKCECGNEFGIVECAKCNSKNSYANRFCTECGQKLWTSDICEINYGEITSGIIRDKFPPEMRNTIFHSRFKEGLKINFPGDFRRIDADNQHLQSNKSRVEDQLIEILSRWKIVSPHYCINCFSIMKADEYRCRNCGTFLPDAEKRLDYLKNKKYKKPVFDRVELKWNSKFSENYLDSLAPTMGESQFEYRERLKWEFAENTNLKKWIADAINREIDLKRQEEKRKREAEELRKLENKIRRQTEERQRQEEEYIRKYGGGYCGSSCRYYYEEVITSEGISLDYSGDMYGVDYCCSLGHTVSYGSFCKDYE